jgi:hypothetical protein
MKVYNLKFKKYHRIIPKIYTFLDLNDLHHLLS